MRKIEGSGWLEQWIPLLLLAFPFLIGGIIGTACAAMAEGEGAIALKQYIEAYLSAAEAGLLSTCSFWSLLWDNFRFPVLVFLLGFTGLGLLGIPILLGVRGFLLAFSLSSFIKLFGVEGAGVAFTLLGVAELVVLPVLFILGEQGIGSSKRLLERMVTGKRTALIFERVYFVRSLGCFVVLLLCSFIQYLIIPILQRAAVGVL